MFIHQKVHIFQMNKDYKKEKAGAPKVGAPPQRLRLDSSRNYLKVRNDAFKNADGTKTVLGIILASFLFDGGKYLFPDVRSCVHRCKGQNGIVRLFNTARYNAISLGSCRQSVQSFFGVNRTTPRT